MVPPDPATRDESDRPVLLVGAIVASGSGFVEFVTGGWTALGHAFPALVACGVLAWCAYGFRHAARAFPIFVALATVAGFHAVVPMMSVIAGSAVLGAIALSLLWSALLLHPAINALLALYAFLLLVFSGTVLVAGLQDVETVMQVPSAVLATYLGVPVALGLGVRLRARAVSSTLKRNVEQLRRSEEALRRHLATKAEELERSREQLFQAQKLQTVGTMASGLAHELNNILTPIRGLAELIAEGAETEQSSRYGRRILDSAVAAAQITGALLTYTRQGTFSPLRTNLRQLLSGQILPVLARSLPGNVHLRVDLDRNVSSDIDRVLFQQCITNLIFNAIDALPDGGEIHIGLTTSPMPVALESIDESSTPLTDPFPRAAVLTVTDTGTGIDAELLPRIFDPFFTTKSVGAGTGLGLAMVQGIVTRHQGRVLVESEIGRGTKFTILLPLAVSESPKNKDWPVLGSDSAGPAVLVVSRDQDALDEFEELLRGIACAPICTSEIHAATTLLGEMGDRIDLLVLDVELSATESPRLLPMLREVCPELAIILVSDAPTDPLIQRMIGIGPTRLLRKPVDPRLLATLLTDLLHPELGYVRSRTPIGTTQQSSTQHSPSQT